MDLEKRRSTIRNESDAINSISLEHHRRLKNNQIMQKFKDKQTAANKQSPTLNNKLIQGTEI